MHSYSIIILPKNQEHRYFSSTDDPWDIFWVHFKGKLAAQYLPETVNKVFFSKHISDTSADSIMSLFWQIIQTFVPGFSYDRVFFASQLLSVLLAQVAFKLTDISSSTSNNQYVNKAIQYIYDNIGQPLRLNDISKHIGISESYLSRLFKNSVNTSINQFITTIKIKQASHYLQYTNLTIQTIAHRLGYVDSYYFSRVFKKEIGIPPRKFRQQK